MPTLNKELLFLATNNLKLMKVRMQCRHKILSLNTDKIPSSSVGIPMKIYFISGIQMRQ